MSVLRTVYTDTDVPAVLRKRHADALASSRRFSSEGRVDAAMNALIFAGHIRRNLRSWFERHRHVNVVLFDGQAFINSGGTAFKPTRGECEGILEQRWERQQAALMESGGPDDSAYRRNMKLAGRGHLLGE